MNNYVLGLDVGERRIGVALASTVARLPAPLTTIDRNKITDTFAHIRGLVQQHEAGVVVVGLPRGLQGNTTAQTEVTKAFATELSKWLDVPVVMQDEAGTSVEAERLLKARGKPFEKADIDAEAAALILQDYLNSTAGRTA